MSNLVDINGAPIPTQEQKTQLETVNGLVIAISAMMDAQGADINVRCSVAINLLMRSFEQLPEQAEKPFINQTMQVLAQAFGQTMIVKHNVAKEARRAAQETLQAANGKLNS